MKPLGARISELFARGYSIDRISEIGCTGGWTRADVLRVVKDNGWTVDWHGRLSQNDLARLAFAVVPVKVKFRMVVVPDATIEEMVELANDHVSASVRMAADRTRRAVSELRKTLIDFDRGGAPRSDPLESPPSGSGSPVEGSPVPVHRKAL